LSVKRLAAAAAAFVVLAAIVSAVFVHESGGIREVLQLPAVVAGPHVFKQDGFTLVAVTRGRPDDSNITLPSGAKMFLAAEQSSGDTILWIAPPILPPAHLSRSKIIHDSGQHQSFYAIEAVTSAGDRFRVPWYYEGGCLEEAGEPCIDSRIASFSPHIIAAVVPAGYPAGITTFDISITDPFGHKAHWLLTQPPKMLPAMPASMKEVFEKDGAALSLRAIRTFSPAKSGKWPVVHLYMTVRQLAPAAKHNWALFQRHDTRPTLSWQPYKMPWMTATADKNARRPVSEFWLFSRLHSFTDEFDDISSPYVRNNETAAFRGVLSQYETRVDAIHLKNVEVQTIRAYEGGFYEDTFCIKLPHSVELISGSGLTFLLPAQQKTPKKILLMSPNSLNLIWKLSPVTPGHNSDTSAMLPDSPLCRNYHRPVSVWFEASVDGKPLGVGAGLPDKEDIAKPIMVHFPVPLLLPPVIRDLKITVHQRVDIQRIPVTLTARIENEIAGNKKPAALSN